MTEWNYCPVCAQKLDIKDNLPTCLKGHFTKYPNPVAATSAFIHNAGEYLIIKRADEPQKGNWDLPGGFVEYDESGEESLFREIEEETTLKNIRIKSFIGAFSGNYSGIQKVLDLAFEVESDDRHLKLSDENTEYKWVSLEEMPELAFEDINEAKELLKRKNGIISE